MKQCLLALVVQLVLLATVAGQPTWDVHAQDLSDPLLITIEAMGFDVNEGDPGITGDETIDGSNLKIIDNLHAGIGGYNPGTDTVVLNIAELGANPNLYQNAYMLSILLHEVAHANHIKYLQQLVSGICENHPNPELCNEEWAELILCHGENEACFDVVAASAAVARLCEKACGPDITNAYKNKLKARAKKACKKGKGAVDDCEDANAKCGELPIPPGMEVSFPPDCNCDC